MLSTAAQVRLRFVLLTTTLVFLGVASLRLTQLGHPLLFLAVPLAPAAATTTFLLLALSFSTRRIMVGLATLSLVILALGASTLGARLRCAHGDSDGSSEMLLYSHNVGWRQGDPKLLAKQVDELRPDVVLLQEADEAFIAEFSAAQEHPFHYAATSAASKTLSLTTLSRWPIVESQDSWTSTQEINPFLAATIATPSGDLRVLNLHMSAPRSSDLIARRSREYQHLAREGQAFDLIAGDFNSSAAHLDFRNFLGQGFQDGHSQAGCGLGTTWTPLPVPIGVLALDHITTADRLTVTSFQQHGFAGSDHRGISARTKY